LLVAMPCQEVQEGGEQRLQWVPLAPGT
jgi:hypothetical protein